MWAQAPCESLSPGLLSLNLLFFSPNLSSQVRAKVGKVGREGPTGGWGWVDSGVPLGYTSPGRSAPHTAVCPHSLGGDSDIQCVLQDSSSLESNGSPEPKRPGGSEAASGSQEKLDFNRNLKEGKTSSAPVRDGGLGGEVLGQLLLSPLVSSSRAGHREAAVQ